MNLKDILIVGRKYTICRFDVDGFPMIKQFICSNVVYKHATETNTIVIKGPAHELKWTKFIKLPPGDQFVIWDGYKAVNTSILVCQRLIQTRQGQSMEMYRWSYFDPRYLSRAKRSVFQKPCAEFLLPEEPENLIVYQCVA